jgi:hypothetical protein
MAAQTAADKKKAEEQAVVDAAKKVREADPKSPDYTGIRTYIQMGPAESLAFLACCKADDREPQHLIQRAIKQYMANNDEYQLTLEV